MYYVWLAVQNSDGSLKWTSASLGQINEAPLIGADNGGTVYVGTTSGTLYALSPVDGSTSWSLAVSGGIYSAIMMDLQGTLYFSTLASTFLTSVFSANHSLHWAFSYTGASSSQSTPAVDVNTKTIWIGAGTQMRVTFLLNS